MKKEKKISDRECVLYMNEINDILEPLKVESALDSELRKLEFRRQYKPQDISILDYTIIECIKKQVPNLVKEVVKIINDYDSVSYICSSCNWNVSLGNKFCSHCGQKLNWKQGSIINISPDK